MILNSWSFPYHVFLMMTCCISLPCIS